MPSGRYQVRWALPWSLCPRSWCTFFHSQSAHRQISTHCTRPPPTELDSAREVILKYGTVPKWLHAHSTITIIIIFNSQLDLQWHCVQCKHYVTLVSSNTFSCECSAVKTWSNWYSLVVLVVLTCTEYSSGLSITDRSFCDKKLTNS